MKIEDVRIEFLHNLEKLRVLLELERTISIKRCDQENKTTLLARKLAAMREK